MVEQDELIYFTRYQTEFTFIVILINESMNWCNLTLRKIGTTGEVEPVRAQHKDRKTHVVKHLLPFSFCPVIFKCIGKMCQSPQISLQAAD